MAGVRLTQRRVDALRSRRTVRDVTDTALKGYGVRVMPSGTKRYLIHSQHRGRRVWKTVGDARVMTEAEARIRARSMLAAFHDNTDVDAELPGEVPFEKVAEEVFARYSHRWKPRTLEVNRIYLRRQIRPTSKGVPSRQSPAETCKSGFVHSMPHRARRTVRPQSCPSSCRRRNPGVIALRTLSIPSFFQSDITPNTSELWSKVVYG